MHGYATAAELLALGEEAFAGVAFANEGIVFVAELIPEFVEELVVGTMDDVAQSNQQIIFIAQNGGSVLLVQHSISDLYQGQELAFITWIPEAQADLLAMIVVEPQKICFCGVKFGQYSDSPSSLSHYGLD